MPRPMPRPADHLSQAVPAEHKNGIRITAEKLAAVLGRGPKFVMVPGNYALPSAHGVPAVHPVTVILASQGLPKFAGDRSILDNDTPQMEPKQASEGQNGGQGEWTQGQVNTDFVTEVLGGSQYKLAAAQRRFWSFVFPDGETLALHACNDLVKAAFAGLPAQPVHPAFAQQPAAAPGASQGAFSAPPATQGASPIAPGHATLTGVSQRPIGLDQPMDTRATALPGAPGHAATNVIDRQGALDPRGLTVDGNNSASVTKFAAFSIRGWLQEKQAIAATQPAIEDEKKRRTGRTPWQGLGLGGGLGLAGAASLGTAYGLASDKQISRVRDAASNYNPEAFTHGKLPPNNTGLTYYQKTMSPAAQLRPFGRPVGEAMVALRSSPAIMKALGTEAYALKSPAEQFGVSGLSHYNMFGNGPVPAYAHQVKARLGTAPVDAAMGAPEGSMYSDWMGRKFEDFVAQHTGQRINPFEFTTKFMPHEDQVGLMEKFHQSLTPEQQAYRVKMEDPGAGYANQVNNYLPKAEGFANARDTLKNMGIAGLGAGAGAVSGNMLYDALNDDDPTNDSALLRAASTLGGAGLGGAAAYYGGTNAGRQAVQRLLGGVKLAHESPTDLTQAQVDWFHQALKKILGHAATNVIDRQGALDPRGLTVDGNNSASVTKFAAFSIRGWLQEKQADVLSSISHHMPRIRALDTALGAGLGAGAGALTASFADPDEDGKRPYLSRVLGGAALGAGAANLVGDRTRRYLSNKLPLYGYETDAAKALTPRSWNDFYNAAIADKRTTLKGSGPEFAIRRELLRRGMDLPPVSQGDQPFLMSAGRKDYTPTETSGGIPGKFEHVQFSPDGWKRYTDSAEHIRPGDATRAYNALVDPPASVKAVMTPVSPADAGEWVGKSYAGRAWKDLLARHGYRNNGDGTTSVHDLWDFALSPQERRIAVRTALGLEGPLNQPYSSELKSQNNVGNWRSTLDLTPSQVNAPKQDILKSMLQRFGLQSLTNGGVVFDQPFDQEGRPVFQKRSGVKLAHEVPTDLTQAQVDWFHQTLKKILGQDGNQPGECNQKLALVTKQADGGPRYITPDELKAYGKNSNVMELLKKGHGPKKCRECGTVSQCRCPSSVHGSLPGTFMDPGECWKCRERVAAENTSPEHVVKTAKEEHKTWIGVDLDGTLAKYNGWKGETHIGEPIPLMVNRVKEWLAAGKDVRIMTARVANVDDDTVENAIKAWCKEHLGQELPVTNVKDHQMEELWDDRAHRVEKNTGVKLAAIKQAIGSGNGLYLPGITPGPPVLAAPKPPVPAAPKPLPSRSTPWSQLPIANVTPRPNPKPAPGLQSWLSALRTPKTPAWLANKQTTIQSQKDMTDTRPMLQMANPAHRGRWWGTQDLTNFLHDDTGRRNFATEMAQHSLPDRPVNEFLQHPIAEALFERRNIATPYQMGTSNVADFPEGITRQSITGGLVKLTGKPAAGIPAPAVANHEFEHARQLIVTPHYDAHQRDFDDSTNEIVARMKGNSPLEIPAGLGDLVFTGEMADNILRERTGRGIEPGGEGPSVTYPNGVQHSVRSMLDQAKQHGYWDGRTMTDLLQTPEGQQYFRRISNPGNQ